MKKLKGIAGFCTALLMTFQLSAQTIVLAAEQDSFQINPVNITDNGYGYEVEGISKSLQEPQPQSCPLPMTQETQASSPLLKLRQQQAHAGRFQHSPVQNRTL